MLRHHRRRPHGDPRELPDCILSSSDGKEVRRGELARGRGATVALVKSWNSSYAEPHPTGLHANQRHLAMADRQGLDPVGRLLHTRGLDAESIFWREMHEVANR